MVQVTREALPVRVRIAPSPTGEVHLGTLATAITNWLFARHYGGAFLVRIEDTDQERSSDAHRQLILDVLEWMHLLPDEEVVIQSQRLDVYKKEIKRLLLSECAYYCACSPEELIERNKKRFDADYLFAGYDEHCRYRAITKEEYPHAVIRFALPKDTPQTLVFDDIIRKQMTMDKGQFDDFVIVRSDGMPLYNLAVVIDDYAMNISHVIRGEDHITNTFKQLLLYNAFGYTLPHFAHLPLILGPGGDRLSKRDAATSVMEYKKAGYLPDALLNYLTRLGWAHGDQEIFTRQELIQLFALRDVGKKGSMFDLQKLNWVNAMHMRKLSPQDIWQMIVTTVVSDAHEKFSRWTEQQRYDFIALYRDRVSTLRELYKQLLYIHDAPCSFEHDEKIDKFLAAKVLEDLRYRLTFKDWGVREDIKQWVQSYCELKGCSMAMVARPIRVALVGEISAPGIIELLFLIGKEESLRRIDTYIRYLRSREKRIDA
ncbi:MAG: glutamate--tRNA ligase [Candidatus Babeliales bacterium]